MRRNDGEGRLYKHRGEEEGMVLERGWRDGRQHPGWRGLGEAGSREAAWEGVTTLQAAALPHGGISA